MKKTLASIRFLAMFFAIILVFGLGGSLIFAAFDKAETQSKAPLFDLGTMISGAVHFIQTLIYIATVGTDHYGTPYHTYFLTGLATTIEYCFISMPLALGIGFVLALMSGAKLRIIRVPARTFVEFVRNTPLLVQMLAIYNGLLFLPHWLLGPFTAGIATLTLNYAAYECENLRAGLAAVERGQSEAAATLGLSQWETLRLVVTPQMIPVVMPPVINDLIYMFKDSSILSLITVLELTLQTNVLTRHFPAYIWQFFTLGALFYLALSLPLGRLARTVEDRIRAHRFAVGRNLTTLAGQALGVSLIVGWVAGGLAVGISAAGMLSSVGMIILALILSLTLLLAVMVILGLPVYLVASARGVIGRSKRGLPPSSQSLVTGPLAAKIKI